MLKIKRIIQNWKYQNILRNINNLIAFLFKYGYIYISIKKNYLTSTTTVTNSFGAV